MMYRAVPPPEQKDSTTADVSQKSSETSVVPENVKEEQWKRFQLLKARREEESGRSTQQRAAAIKKRALRAVSKELSEEDKDFLKDEGIHLPPLLSNSRRKRKQVSTEEGEEELGGRAERSAGDDGLETQWQEVRQFMDPNPQLKGVEKGRYAPKSKLEEELDSAIERRDFDKASALSDKLTQRKFAKQVTTAFNCHEYIKKRKVDKEKKTKKLKWSFEPKHRWESKGNM